MPLSGSFVYSVITSRNFHETRRQLNNEIRKGLIKSIGSAGVFCFKRFRFFSFLGSVDSGYACDIHQIWWHRLENYISSFKSDQPLTSLRTVSGSCTPVIRNERRSNPHNRRTPESINVQFKRRTTLAIESDSPTQINFENPRNPIDTPVPRGPEIRASPSGDPDPPPEIRPSESGSPEKS